MLDEEVKAVVLAIIVVASVFAVAQAMRAGTVVEPFSALGLLGPKMKIGDYPKVVLVNETIRLYLYVGNYEGKVMYYVIYAKLGDRSTLINESIPADAPILAEYKTILPHGANTTIPIEISIDKPMENARLIFEMWILDPDSKELRYHGRWNQLWLNITTPEIAES